MAANIHNTFTEVISSVSVFNQALSIVNVGLLINIQNIMNMDYQYKTDNSLHTAYVYIKYHSEKLGHDKIR